VKVSEQRARQYVRDLLLLRNWNVDSTLKQGQLLEETEYKNHSNLSLIFSGKSKTGTGDGYPDFLLVDSYVGLKPLIIIETKALSKDIRKAVAEAIHYGEALKSQGINVICIGVAGNEQDLCAIKVVKYLYNEWQYLTLRGEAIDWIPSQKQIEYILSIDTVEVEPERPNENILNDYANRLNEILRECNIKDEFRPTYAATIMLALWQGSVSTENSIVLEQINSNAAKALKRAGKSELSNSLRVDTENDELASRAWEIVEILNKLNIRSFIHEHDYLGQLYETFFRYTGGNTIGQYFTPRHIINFLCELVEVTNKDIILDPACGTGGFLIGAINRMITASNRVYEEAVSLINNNLFGIESEPATAALCITNMILRGDGKSGIIKDDCFRQNTYPGIEVDFVLMNPPFPHKKTDTPPTNFIDRGLKQLKNKGVLGTIIPYALLVRVKEWHKKILQDNTILFIATLPSDLFNPYASYNTALLILQKGIPQSKKKTFVCRITNDGYKLKKNNRIAQDGSQLAQIIDMYRTKKEEPELSALAMISTDSNEWSPEAFIKSRIEGDVCFIDGIEQHIRKHAGFYVQNGWRLEIDKKAKQHDIKIDYTIYDNKSEIDLSNCNYGLMRISEYFTIELGGNDEIEDLETGNIPIVSTSEFMNGVTAWKNPKYIYDPPVITVATDGSTCSSFVQEYPFYAFYKVAILKEKRQNSIPIDALYYISYLLFREKWKYVYARKFGKERIKNTLLSVPFNNDHPDFIKMQKIIKKTRAYNIINSFRESYKSEIIR
jgi:type I restriction-modification system DNA methylase subunit